MNKLLNRNSPSHWQKYKVYYLVSGSFLLLLTFILLVNSSSNSEIKKINRRLNRLKNENNNDLPDIPPQPHDNHNFKSGDFIYPSVEQKNENWLEENVFQDSVRQEFEVWANSVKYLPRYRIGGVQEPEQHALLYGPPGSGKSFLAEKFAQNESLAYINANFGFEVFAGSNQVKVNKVMTFAENLLKKNGNAKPVVIIIDEIDSIGTKHSHSHTSSQEVNALLTMIDNIKSKELNIIVIGITNYPQSLDSALKRAGRLGRQIEVPYLTKEEITNMVKYLEKDLKKDKIGSYKHEGNKSKWDKDKDKDKEIEWTDNFWSEVLQITLENFEKCKQAKVGISYTDLELTIKTALAKKVGKDTQKITPQSSDFKKELERKVVDKIKDKPKPRIPNPQPYPDLPE